ncbi:Integrase core domain-containing protein [Nitrosomonas ureae]|uniref:Integrase core domain-containing protein n=1 Tax=Nitrosomonas ureae TaxID=44577 RepID=A0A1H5VFS3_9PROT|nr:Integrase core domain-containing protein [Nitrosomonas ureae]
MLTGMTASMSRKGDCYDNAPMESFWGILKTELVHHRRFKTRQQAIREITEYIESSITDRENRKDWDICHQHNLRSNTMSIYWLLKSMDSIFDSTYHLTAGSGGLGI